jgi:hypothetical protein
MPYLVISPARRSHADHRSEKNNRSACLRAEGKRKISRVYNEVSSLLLSVIVVSHVSPATVREVRFGASPATILLLSELPCAFGSLEDLTTATSIHVVKLAHALPDKEILCFFDESLSLHGAVRERVSLAGSSHFSMN